MIRLHLANPAQIPPVTQLHTKAQPEIRHLVVELAAPLAEQRWPTLTR